VNAREMLLDGGPKFGALCTLGDVFALEVLGHCGFDWICIDRQHGSFGEGELYPLLQALSSTGTPALVRVPGHDDAAIMRALDAGAAGVIVPMIESAASAAQVAAACRYPPRGTRSWGPTRARHLTADYSAGKADAAVLCGVMIETTVGLDNLDEIAAVPGVDGVFAGPSDLALALGRKPSLTEPDDIVIETIDAVRGAFAANGKFAGIFTVGAEQGSRWSSRGFTLISVHSDRLLMSDGAEQLLSEIRAHTGDRV
jgi:4-hydroxy-2-oxoheptanedioate aldolase